MITLLVTSPMAVAVSLPARLLRSASASFSSPSTSSSQVVSQKSSSWGTLRSSSRILIPEAASDSSTTRPSSPISTAAFHEQDTSNKRTSSVAAAAKNTTSPVCVEMLSSAADEDDVTPAEGSSSSAGSSRTTCADAKSWRVARAERKTTRRRVLAICLALAGFSLCGRLSSGLEQDQSPPTQARDFISVSQSTAGVPFPSVSPGSMYGFGDLVTLSTGSSGSSSDGLVKGLPSWMRSNYHLCMGDGFHIQLPADWHMHDTQGQVYGTVLRYEDKADPCTNVVVLKSPTSQALTDNLGNREDWIREQTYLLTGNNEPLQFQAGDESMDAAKMFLRGRISFAKVLNAEKPTSKQGLTYYNYEIVTKQGGKQTDLLHELVSAVVNNGTLYLCRVQSGEDRWQENTQSMAQHIVDSFQITGFKIHV